MSMFYIDFNQLTSNNKYGRKRLNCHILKVGMVLFCTNVEIKICIYKNIYFHADKLWQQEMEGRWSNKNNM